MLNGINAKRTLMSASTIPGVYAVTYTIQTHMYVHTHMRHASTSAHTNTQSLASAVYVCTGTAG
jgi:hypothetical protein